MILHENSLYTSDIERIAFVADNETVANSLVYNFFGFLSLYSLSEKKAQMKRYLTDEKDTVRLAAVGSENTDVSLAVKLAVEAGMPERAGILMLKMLTKINQRTLKGSEIDENNVRELLKQSHLLTSFKPSAVLLSIMKEFSTGEINLTFLAYKLSKHVKKFVGVNAEFYDYYKKGYYSTTYSDYMKGILRSPRGVPAHLVKTTTPLTTVYTKVDSVDTNDNDDAVAPAAVVEPVVAPQPEPQAEPVVSVAAPAPSPAPVAKVKKPVIIKIDSTEDMAPVVKDYFDAFLTDTGLDEFKKKYRVTNKLALDFKNYESQYNFDFLSDYSYDELYGISKRMREYIITRAGKMSGLSPNYKRMYETLIELGILNKGFEGTSALIEFTQLDEDFNHLLSSYNVVPSKLMIRVLDAIAANDSYATAVEMTYDKKYSKMLSDVIYPKIRAISKGRNPSALKGIVDTYPATFQKFLPIVVGDAITSASTIGTKNADRLLQDYFNAPDTAFVVSTTKILKGAYEAFPVLKKYCDLNPNIEVVEEFNIATHTVKFDDLISALEESSEFYTRTLPRGIVDDIMHTFDNATFGTYLPLNKYVKGFKVMYDEYKNLGFMIKNSFADDCAEYFFKWRVKSKYRGERTSFLTTADPRGSDEQAAINEIYGRFAVALRDVGSQTHASALNYFLTKNMNHSVVSEIIRLSAWEPHIKVVLDTLNSEYEKSYNAGFPTVHDIVHQNTEDDTAWYCVERTDAFRMSSQGGVSVLRNISGSSTADIYDVAPQLLTTLKYLSMNPSTVQTLLSDMITRIVTIYTRVLTSLDVLKPVMPFVASEVVKYTNLVESLPQDLSDDGKAAQAILKIVKSGYNISSSGGTTTANIKDFVHVAFNDKPIFLAGNLRETLYCNNVDERVKKVKGVIANVLSSSENSSDPVAIYTFVNSALNNSLDIGSTVQTIIDAGYGDYLFKKPSIKLGEDVLSYHSGEYLTEQLIRFDGEGMTRMNDIVANNDIDSDSVLALYVRNGINKESYNYSQSLAFSGVLCLGLFSLLTEREQASSLRDINYNVISDKIDNANWAAYERSVNANTLKKIPLATAKKILEVVQNVAFSEFTISNDYKAHANYCLKIIREFNITPDVNTEKLDNIKSAIKSEVKIDSSSAAVNFTLSNIIDQQHVIRPDISTTINTFDTAVKRNRTNFERVDKNLHADFTAAATFEDVLAAVDEGKVYDYSRVVKRDLTSLKKLAVTELNYDEETLERITVNILSTSLSGGASGFGVPVVKKAFDVDFNISEIDSDIKPHSKEAIDLYVSVHELNRKNTTQYLPVCFHGTGPMAASFILRYGFKDTGVVVDGPGNSGQMLGDGMYLAINADKAGLYANDIGVDYDSYGARGYLFICEAALAEDGVDFMYANPKNFGVSSAEWVTRFPTQQVWIKKCYEVVIENRKKLAYAPEGNKWDVFPRTNVEY